ncbi:MAG TPA: winged helix-turn-helix domain-containing protein [Thermoanaerobaculia bacterium]|nr:winged helix-turn-helix domain-containing protein [Thermoanaerobaculia bacterium]
MTAISGVTAGDDPRVQARFGTFTLDRKRAELRRDGVLVRLQDQPFRLLVYLLERPGEIVTREELREHLWPAEFVDFDHSLNTAMRKLRTALDDSADQPRYVETLARRGYRFIAPVSWDVGRASARPPVEGRAEARPTFTFGALWAIAVVVAVAVAAFLLWPAAPKPIGAIAVLPFTNSDPRSEYVSDGLTELLIDKLSRLPELRVMARSTVFDYKGKKIPPATAGKELDVGAVITGHLRRERDQYAIHVEMIDVRDGAQLWGERYTASPGELPLVQSRIADDLSSQLRRDADTQGRRFAARAYTANAEAYEQYLLGLQLWHSRGREDLPRSVEHFNRAIALDPNFAAAWSGLANAYGVMSGAGMIPPEEGAVKVLSSARKALALDPENAEAYTSIATTSFRSLWDFESAERDYRRSLALNPNYATGHQWYSDYLRAMGRTEEARREVDTALRLDPLSPATNSAKCYSLIHDRRYEEALAFAARYERLQKRPMQHCTAAARALTGDRSLLLLRQQRLLAQPDPESASSVEIAETYALLGQPDKAFEWLERGAKRRSTRITSFHVSPGLDSLRDDPRFAALAKRIGLPAQAVPR